MRANTNRNRVHRPVASTNASQVYHVKKGDTLARISHAFGISKKELITANPNKAVRIGTAFRIPQKGRAPVANTNVEKQPLGLHRVQNGDTLDKIAKRSGISKQQLLQFNHHKMAMRVGSSYRAPLSRVLPRARNAGNAARNVPSRSRLPRRTTTSVRAANVHGKSASAPFGRYKPYSKEAVRLIQKSAISAGLPENWASNPSMHKLLQKESNGVVGRPNYTYGRSSKSPGRWASVHNDLKRGIKRTESSATGLGQFILANVDKYYPNGRAGIGDPNNEMIGMVRYIKDRYGSPERALAFHLRNNWY